MRRLVWLSLSLTLAGCIGAAIVGSGTIKTENRPVAGIKSIQLGGIGNLQITQKAEPESLTVTTDENLLPLLDTQVAGGKLTLEPKDDANLRPSQSITYAVNVKELESISVNGAAQLDLAGYQGRMLTVKANGAGTVHLTHFRLEKLKVKLLGAVKVTADGSADQQIIEMGGAGNYDGSAVLSVDTTVSSLGSGAVAVYAEKTLDVKLDGVGTVTYYGTPIVTEKMGGVGKVVSGGAHMPRH